MNSNIISVMENIKNIKSAVGSYNAHKLLLAYYKDPKCSLKEIPHWTPEKIQEKIIWHQTIFNKICELLTNIGYSVNDPSFWDNSVFEPKFGLKIKKLINATFDIIEDQYNLEEDLKNSLEIKELVKNDDFARELYAALCNVDWIKDDIDWSCSWRKAAHIVSDLRNKNEDYCNFYCYGSEGTVTERVAKLLKNIGWTFLK